MRNSPFLVLLLAPCLMFSASKNYGQGRPIPPGVREADKQTNAPIEPPAERRQKTSDLAALNREANELAQLSAGVPSDLKLINKGQLPKDLADKLKRIEKLAKHLRSELTR